ncbi:hypothetical protein P152DRAFT_208200 [Eremomyces bilateralis CBS 781.70]|uniref:Uncharacterized protein n=1 Tax=Eremomyces bilateralis CBS 781.70 TaxID=1392243 RepID=A0A6G1FSL5_9PEZI|nr:uncharacterized protein P152DRAFT_208200 [Eremomyces bilateralis CBS 781.70]KAF1808753.1 hypothetical protein P152DRAFT_208200 [Eremomyces bilateralis CBS 781.70]
MGSPGQLLRWAVGQWSSGHVIPFGRVGEIYHNTTGQGYPVSSPFSVKLPTRLPTTDLLSYCNEVRTNRMVFKLCTVVASSTPYSVPCPIQLPSLRQLRNPSVGIGSSLTVMSTRPVYLDLSRWLDPDDNPKQNKHGSDEKYLAFAFPSLGAIALWIRYSSSLIHNVSK